MRAKKLQTPIVLIGRFAGNAFPRIVRTTNIIGTRAVMVQAKDPQAAEFYRQLGFQAFDSDAGFPFVQKPQEIA